METPETAASLLFEARRRAGLTQRQLAVRANTAQSVIARVENGQSAPSLETLSRLVGAAGFELRHQLTLANTHDSHMLDDCARILRLSPEQRLAEVHNISRFLHNAKRV